MSQKCDKKIIFQLCLHWQITGIWNMVNDIHIRSKVDNLKHFNQQLNDIEAREKERKKEYQYWNKILNE